MLQDISIDAIDKAHRSRTDATYALLEIEDFHSEDMDPYEVALHHAVSRHFLEGARSAALSKEPDRFNWYKVDARNSVDQAFSKFALPTDLGTRVLMSPAFEGDVNCFRVGEKALRNSMGEPPCPLIWRDTNSADEEQRRAAQDAFALVADSEFEQLIGQFAPVIVTCPKDIGGEGMTNWTVVSLPGTVYITRERNPVFLGRELLHEAGHNWLNDAFETTSNIPDKDAFFYSPWKMCMRPAFGFLHACWAFPLTVLWSAWALHHTPIDEVTRDELSAYIALQKKAIAYAEKDFETALDLIHHDKMISLMGSTFHAALSARV